eukprot:4875602-Alexandrium_andersonii.AAC.1
MEHRGHLQGHRRASFVSMPWRRDHEALHDQRLAVVTFVRHRWERTPHGCFQDLGPLCAAVCVTRACNAVSAWIHCACTWSAALCSTARAAFALATF